MSASCARSGQLQFHRKDQSTHISEVLLVELWTHHGDLDIVLDVCHTGKAGQSRRKSSFDMLVCVRRKLDTQASNLQIFECGIAIRTGIVEGKLKSWLVLRRSISAEWVRHGQDDVAVVLTLIRNAYSYWPASKV